MSDHHVSTHTMADTSVQKQRVAVIASLTWSLTNFRYQLLKRMTDAGHDVVAFGPEQNDDVANALQRIGVRFVQIPMKRANLSPLADLRTLYALWRQFRQIKPDVLLPYTMKPIIYGGIAGRLSGVPKRYALITGLGYVFTDGDAGFKRGMMRRISVQLYRLALAGMKRVFVYNQDDAADVKAAGLLSDPSLIEQVDGSGVDLDQFPKSQPPSTPVTFLVIARLIRDKGIKEYVAAASILRRRYPEVRFQLIGPYDPNPAGISKEEMALWVDEGAIEYLGETEDVRPYLAAASVFVLPSYREGVPRSVLEAMATGRAIVTTDVPGCRQTVIDGVNGYIVPPRSAEELAAAMEKFIVNSELIPEMGERSYERACRKYDVHAINRKLLTTMQLI